MCDRFSKITHLVAMFIVFVTYLLRYYFTAPTYMSLCSANIINFSVPVTQLTAEVFHIQLVLNLKCNEESHVLTIFIIEFSFITQQFL